MHAIVHVQFNYIYIIQLHRYTLDVLEHENLIDLVAYYADLRYNMWKNLVLPTLAWLIIFCSAMFSPVASRAALHFLPESEERTSEQQLMNIVYQTVLRSCDNDQNSNPWNI